MSRTEMSMLDTTLIGPGLLFFNQYFDTFFNELVILWICFVSPIQFRRTETVYITLLR